MLKQPQFNWEVADKYSEWKAFILEVKNILSTCNVQEHDKITIVKNWLGRKGMHYIESITEVEKQVCSTLQGLFDTLSAKFWPQFNEMIKLLQFRNYADLRMKARRNGWDGCTWQQQNVGIKR